MAHKLETVAVHAGRDDLHTLGVHALPIDLSTTYPTPHLDEATASIDALEAGARTAPNPIYATIHNPTVWRFEDGLARLEGADGAVAFASGMAALTACLLAAQDHGRHVVAIRPLYGGSDHLLDHHLLANDVTWATPNTVAEAIRPDTALVLMETPANPTLALVDIEAVVTQAGSVPVLVDSTFMTPVLQNPLRHGAALVLHSGTKFLGGHGDVVAGVVATNESWCAKLRRVRMLTGGILHPLAAYLLHRGLQTLPLRVRAAQAGARVLVDHLKDHDMVERVLYPGLPACDPLGLVGRQMSGPGSMLAFEVRGGHPAAAAVMEQVELLTPAVSLGSTDTLIQHPAGLTHRVVDPAALKAAGISQGLLRISTGIENPEDLWEDLRGALNRAKEAVFEAPDAPVPLGGASTENRHGTFMKSMPHPGGSRLQFD